MEHINTKVDNLLIEEEVAKKEEICKTSQLSPPRGMCCTKLNGKHKRVFLLQGIL